MAAPASKNIRNLNGKWLINKTISDSPDPVLALQGIGWLTRKAVGLATVTQHVKQYDGPAPETPDGPAFPHVDIDQIANSGLKGTAENRTLDWVYRTHSDWLFGELRGKSRMNTLKAIIEQAKEEGGEAAQENRHVGDAEWLAEGWLEETLNGEVVESFADAVKGWQTWQVWGFSEVNGERWLTRRFVARRKDREEMVRVRLVYEWQGERDE